MKPIFCGNLDFDARQSDVERLFRKYGKIDRVDLKSGITFFIISFFFFYNFEFVLSFRFEVLFFCSLISYLLLNKLSSWSLNCHSLTNLGYVWINSLFAFYKVRVYHDKLRGYI